METKKGMEADVPRADEREPDAAPTADHRHRGHRRRMAKRFAEGGFDGWREHEILERLLFEVLPRRNTNETAHALIRAFGSLRGVLLAEPRALERVPGIGPVSAKWLAALLPRFTGNLLAEMKKTRLDDGGLLILADWFLGYLGRPALFLFLSPDGMLLDARPVDADDGAFPADGRTILVIRDSDAAPRLIRALAAHLVPKPERIFALTKKREWKEIAP
ncbi:MAG: hypothetical protein K6A33_08540 [Clostridiales bacterium]|nr:hypothetical protein [Clostridiales bacterium]